MRKRNVNISFNKGGTGGLSPRMTLPITWLRGMGVDPDNREVNIYSVGKTIIISKDDIEEDLKEMEIVIRRKEIIEDLKKYNTDNAFYADQFLRDLEIPEELLKDEKFIKEATAANPVILRFVKDCYITREIAEIAVEKDYHYLTLTPFKADEKLGIKAVRKNGFFIDRLLDLKDNFNVVKAAVEKDGLALEYVSDRLKSNYDIVKAAVCCEDQGGAIKYASKELRSNKELVILAYEKGGYRLDLGISKDLLKDIDVQRAVVSKRPDNFDLLPDEVQEKYGTVENFLEKTKK